MIDNINTLYNCSLLDSKLNNKWDIFIQNVFRLSFILSNYLIKPWVFKSSN